MPEMLVIFLLLGTGIFLVLYLSDSTLRTSIFAQFLLKSLSIPLKPLAVLIDFFILFYPFLSFLLMIILYYFYDYLQLPRAIRTA